MPWAQDSVSVNLGQDDACGTSEGFINCQGCTFIEPYPDTYPDKSPFTWLKYENNSNDRRFELEIDSDQLRTYDVGTQTVVLRSYIVLEMDGLTDPFRDDEFTINISSNAEIPTEFTFCTGE